MKTKFKNNQELCHAWASMSQDHGRGSNLHFEGRTLISYGWWEIATIVQKEGKTYVIMREKAYSPSTGKQMGLANRAIPDEWERIFVSGLTSKEGYWGGRFGGRLLAHGDNIRNLMYMIEQFSTITKRNLYPAWTIEKNNKLYDGLEKYCWLFDQPFPTEANKFLLDIADFADVIDEAEAKRKEKEETKHARAAERKEKEHQKNIAKIEDFNTHEQRWMDGENVSVFLYIRSVGNFEFTQTRMRIEGSEVVTSRSARVPIREAKILWERIKSGKDIKGFKVGMYTVVGINGTLQIGCHHISREEINRFVNKYNW